MAPRLTSGASARHALQLIFLAGMPPFWAESETPSSPPFFASKSTSPANRGQRSPPEPGYDDDGGGTVEEYVPVEERNKRDGRGRGKSDISQVD